MRQKGKNTRVTKRERRRCSNNPDCRAPTVTQPSVIANISLLINSMFEGREQWFRQARWAEEDLSVKSDPPGTNSFSVHPSWKCFCRWWFVSIVDLWVFVFFGAGHTRLRCPWRTPSSPRWRQPCRNGPYCGSSSMWWAACFFSSRATATKPS